MQLIEHLTTHHKSEGLNLVTVLALLDHREKQIVQKKCSCGSADDRAFDYPSEEQGFESSHCFGTFRTRGETNCAEKGCCGSAVDRAFDHPSQE